MKPPRVKPLVPPALAAIVAVSGVACGLGCGGGQVDPGFGPAATEVAASSEADPQVPLERPRVVLITADWCPACKRTEKAFYPALARFDGRIDLLVLDVTDDEAIASSRQTAAAAGVGRFFEQNRGVTPSIALINQHGYLRRFEGNPYVLRTWERTFREMVGDDERAAREDGHAASEAAGSGDP